MELNSQPPDPSARSKPEVRHPCTPTSDNEEGENGRPSHVWCSDKSLDLCKNNLTCLSCDIPRCIEHLYLEGNLLQELPEELFDHLPHLVWLDLRKNRLQKIPTRIGNHRCLRTLLLETNPLRELPVELGNVSTLKALNLRNCPLHFPPSDVVNLGTQIILSFLREQATKSLPETLNHKADPNHSITNSNRHRKVIKIHNSLEGHSNTQSGCKLPSAADSLISIQGQTLHHKFIHNPVNNRKNIVQSGDYRQNFDVKANTNGNLHQKRIIKEKKLPAFNELLEKRNYTEKIQRKKKQLTKQDIQHEIKEDVKLTPLETVQKNEEAINTFAEENTEGKAEEGKAKQLIIPKGKNFEHKLQHRLQCHQKQRRKNYASMAVLQEDENSEDQNMRKSLVELKLERVNPLEYRFCAFIGDYSPTLSRQVASSQDFS
ncbi:uncharacterized protein LOC132391715 isoform X1 [Hypanus sabinus]|uniref:uncharacterized protein LOC132391715 isoform X1 n=1 Tax=Hypanus sabinus TaxID=79690 RepID=UPI0028C45037|nr:uncharacterized protein LOC132391715 isoform X1 [Hypanus sabinus]